MDLPLWVSWVLVLALALPVVALRGLGGSASRAGTVVLLVPALVMAVVAASMTLDRRSVSQEELDAAVGEAASDLAGSYGPVNAHDLEAIVSRELGRDVHTEGSQLDAPDELNASYTVEVRLSEDEAEPAVCVEVALEVLSQNAPDLRFATVDDTPGPC